MNQLKIRNPQAFQKIEQLRNSNGNPMDLFKQVTSGYSTQQMEQLFNNARNFGVPDEIIHQLQNGIDAEKH